MLRGTVELIHAYADHNLADLDDASEGLPGDVVERLLDAAEHVIAGCPQCADAPEHSPP
ncbi:hypothetical protein GCM10010411_79510 [Actinomadura fulvescens]|uniref:Uncharacterized protein n=1 Tax=Actinomadura fulvescens TaxID=46160 RepID=A0ABP6CWP9_9ACTN